MLFASKQRSLREPTVAFRAAFPVIVLNTAIAVLAHMEKSGFLTAIAQGLGGLWFSLILGGLSTLALAMLAFPLSGYVDRDPDVVPTSPVTPNPAADL